MKFKKAVSRLRPEESLALLMTIIPLVALVFLHSLFLFTPQKVLGGMVEYFSFGNPVFSFFFFFIWMGAFWHTYKALGSIAVRRFVKKEPPIPGEVKAAAMHIWEPFRLLWPLAIFSIPLYGLLDAMSIRLRFVTQDIWLNAIDNSLFGFSPFIHFPSSFQNTLFETLIIYSYTKLPYVLGISFIVSYLTKHITLLRRHIFAFLMSLAIGFPIFFLVPCQDPNNFFLRNLRHKDFPPSVSTELSQYRPSSRVRDITNIIATVETSVEHDNSVPISCFPSSHAMWALLVVYSFAVLSPWSLAVSLPWLFFLLSGGIYFAQHYVIDYIVALPVTIVCILLARYFITDSPEQTTL